MQGHVMGSMYVSTSIICCEMAESFILKCIAAVSSVAADLWTPCGVVHVLVL